MKLQWVLVAVVLAAVVFGFTYLKLNSGPDTTKPPPPPPSGDVKLSFPRTASRDRDEGAIGAEWEAGVPGQHAFLFENIFDQPINFGLEYKTCKCTKVDVALATDEWKRWNAAMALNLTLRTRGRLDAMIADSVDRGAWQIPEPRLDWQPLPDQNPGFEVPPHASGWVRFNWKAENIGSLLLIVKLWTHAQEGTTPLTELTVPIIIVPPVTMDKRDKEVGTISADKPLTKSAMFICWSATRSSFMVKPAEGNDPFLVIGQPVPLTAEERAQVQETLFQNSTSVLGAYRIPVAVRDRLDDGKQLDLGPFRIQAFFQVEGMAQPLEIRVGGMVQGEVAISSPEGLDRISMGNKGYFDAAYGDAKDATVQTRNLNLSLAIDKVPSFLRVELKEPKIVAGIKTWDLRVEVPKRAIAGEFPREDNPEYRDSAVYLKMIDTKNPNATTRRIRIPVSGKASSR